MTKERIIKVLKENLEHQKVAYDSVYSWNTELTEVVEEAIKLLEQNTVSEEVYTEEYKARKQAEYELFKIKKQQSSDNYEYNRGYRDGYDKGNLNGYELRKSEEKISEDCVSRQAVLNLINADWEYEGLELPVNDLPPVTPTQRWIPVSEELPKKNMPCLVSIGILNLTESAMYSDLMGTFDHKIFYQGDYGHGSFMDITEYVKAWQPLPKPYEEKRGNEE